MAAGRLLWRIRGASLVFTANLLEQSAGEGDGFAGRLFLDVVKCGSQPLQAGPNPGGLADFGEAPTRLFVITVAPTGFIGTVHHDAAGQLAWAMATGRSIVVNGDLGSGKSTVSTLLAQRLGIPRISVGDLYREMARQRGVTALELNLHAELDDKIDHYVDRLQSDIAMSGERLVVDSRLAWFFFRDALKVHLVTDPTVAAYRVLGRRDSGVESYASVAEARERLAQRSESERMRFIDRYGADKTRLRNYDLVCDSTRATPQDIVACVVEALAQPPDGDTRLFIDPTRIRRGADRGPGSGPVRLRYARPHFFVVEGHHTVATAAREGRPLVQADLAAECDEPTDEA